MLATLSIVLAVTAPASGPAADLEKKVLDLFEEKCTVCHDSNSDEIDLENPPSKLLGEKSKTTNKPFVVPGDPEASYLWNKVTSESGIKGEVMPLGDDRLTEDKLAIIRDWIMALPKPGGDAGGGGGAAAGAGDTGDTGGGAASGGADTAALEADLAAKQQAAADAEKPVQALMGEYCTTCHDSSSDEVVLEGSLTPLIGKNSAAAGKPFVVPGDVEGSYLWTKMTTDQGIEGEVMPLGDDPLPADKVEPVKRWIAALGEVEDAKAALAAAGAAPPEGPGEGTNNGGGVTTDPGGGDEECAKKDRKGRCKVDRKRSSDPPFRDIFFVNLPTTAGLGKNSIQFRITHHFGRIGTPRGYFGLDAGAVMSLGLAYGIIDGLDLVLRRSNSRKAYELGVKYIPIQQEYEQPVSFGGYASIEYYRDFDTNTANPVSGNFQLMLSRLWFERWSTQLVLGYHLRTNHAANVTYDFGDGNGPVAATDTRDTMNVGIASQIRLGKKKYHSIDLEYLFPIPAQAFFWNGALEDQANVGAWSLGWTAITPSKKHVFKIFLTNTREIHTNLVAPGGQTRNPFPAGQKYPFDFYLGFTISRRWSL